MNSIILNTVIQEFIKNNLYIDTGTLLLRKHQFEGVTIKEIVEQIEAKKRCKTKLPSWYNTANVYYPNKLNIEQTSSEIAAKYKSEIISGKNIIDLTGGLGVDCFYFSKSFESVVHCELQEKLALIAKHNFKVLTSTNINSINTSGVQYLRSKKEKYDWIYLDPSRRNDIKGKVFYLKDCIPNVPEVLDELFEYSQHILIKTSPMLDISVGISELQGTKEIHVVAVNNEVKEVLFLLEKGYIDSIEVKTVNLRNDGNQKFDFTLENESLAKPTVGEIQDFLYEPNAAIMKSGAFKSISDKFSINKLHQHAHLYTSKTFIEFPGRSFKVVKVIPYNRRKIKSLMEKESFNVSIRNFPESVSQLKKKFKFRDGGEKFVFFTTNHNNEKVVVFCVKS